MTPGSVCLFPSDSVPIRARRSCLDCACFGWKVGRVMQTKSESSCHRLWHNFAKTVRKLLKNSGRACKPDSVEPRQVGVLTIIPLGRGSRHGSSSLPEGCSQSRLAPLLRERGKLSFASLGEPGRLSPPIWPCTTRGFPCLACCQTSGGLLT